MILSVIVAASRNNVIGRDNDLPWRLSSDLKRFKSLTMGHHMIMGRKTYESINRLLPGRTTVILTKRQGYSVDGALIANSLDQAIKLAEPDSECFVIGGAEIYRLALPLADRIYLTRVETEIDGDTELPDIDWDAYELKSEENVPVDDRNEYESTFQVYHKLS